MNANIRSSQEPDGVLLATIDMPGKTMNVFSADLMDSFDELMDRVDGDPAVKSVVLTSEKSSFLAGADLVMVRGYCDAAASSSHEAMFELCGRLGRQFVRLEASSKPWVAAVNGIALGGGLELAMACRARLVADDPRIQLGLPEVRWGLLPGAGGTQRLPRLAGFDAGMDLLLTGRSVSPTEAVRLGIFERAVPGAELRDSARALARSLQDQAYDASTKFAHMAQVDVPPYSEDAAKAVASKHAVSDSDFANYPAYSAIIDSVLRGARLPLAEATAVEMHQFLRLMFDPVAGNMVTTLFLERLRAERELAAPPGTGIERLRMGVITGARSAWTDALGKLKLAPLVDAGLPVDTLEIVDHRGDFHQFSLRVLGEDAAKVIKNPLLVLAPAGPYGHVIEIVGAQGSAAAACAVLAQKLRCLPWRTPGPSSVLQRLHGQPLAAQQHIARSCAVEAGAADPAFLDVACCLAGVTPAWTGGPLTSLDQPVSKR